MEEEEDDVEEMELPDAIILTNLPKIIFEDKDLKRELEELFKEVDPHATFLYFKVRERGEANRRRHRRRDMLCHLIIICNIIFHKFVVLKAFINP